MKCLLLAAGYATRLYPLTENFPKPLLKIGEKSILDHLVDDIDKSGAIDEYAVISNHKFAHYFDEWVKTKSQTIHVVDDGTSTNETRLGAVRDIEYAIKKLNIDDDVLVLAGDNVLDFSLCEFIEYIKDRKTSCIMRYYEEDETSLHKRGVIETDENDVVLNMEEKPDEPKSHWCAPPFYYYTKEDAKKIAQAIDEGCGIDAPGSFISWLCKDSTVHAMKMPGRRYDVGNLESYNRINEQFKKTI